MVDLAGLQDTGGQFPEFVNLFIDRYIFMKSKQLRFLVPITITQMRSGNGGEVKKQILILKRMFSGNLTQMQDSILPIITKCKPDDEDLDIDLLRQQFREIFEEDTKKINDETEKDR
jgi:hypothetical protein